MAKIIRDQTIVEDDWLTLDDTAPLPASGKIILSWLRWQTEQAGLQARRDIGVAIPSNLDLAELKDALPRLSLVAVAFNFIQPKPEGGRTYDGRAYSQARLLRERYGFKGEIRATGDVFRDSMHYMQRCGINAFAMNPGQDLTDALKAFNDFSDAYQGAADHSTPVYRRRGGA